MFPTYGVPMPDVDVFAALANPVRREILVHLRAEVVDSHATGY